MFRFRSVKLLFLALTLSAAALSAAPRWPTLAEQRAQSRVVPGTALDKLMARNQDFRSLDPREAADTLGIPAWLRVFWRKSFPAWRYQPGDPSHGYPLVLKDFYEWALAHPDLHPGPQAKSAPSASSDAAEGLPEAATVGANLRISDPRKIRAESDIRINFWEPQKVIAAANDLSAGNQAMFYSSDGGASWRESSLPLVLHDLGHSDPTVDWTSDGTAWSTTIGIGLIFDSSGVPIALILHMRAYRSTDGGATWAFDSTFSGAQIETDKQMTWVDHSATSPYKDNLYACWHDGNPAFVNHRSAATGRWGRPIQVSGAESGGTSIGCDVKTNANGDVFVVWPSTGSRTIGFVKSTDGGATWSAPRVLAHTFGSFDIGIPSMNRRRAFIYTTSGTFRAGGKDLVYAAWTDISGEAGCARPALEPAVNAASSCKTRIWFTRSTDGGATWAAPRKINDGAARNDQFNPWMAVDETSGTLGIIYYDTIADPGRRETDLWFQGSSDDGTTWDPPLKVTTGRSDESRPGRATSFQYGDYNGMSAYLGRFLPIWTDHRAGAAKDTLYTAPIDNP